VALRADAPGRRSVAWSGARDNHVGAENRPHVIIPRARTGDGCGGRARLPPGPRRWLPSAVPTASGSAISCGCVGRFFLGFLIRAPFGELPPARQRLTPSGVPQGAPRLRLAPAAVSAGRRDEERPRPRPPARPASCPFSPAGGHRAERPVPAGARPTLTTGNDGAATTSAVNCCNRGSCADWIAGVLAAVVMRYGRGERRFADRTVDDRGPVASWRR